MNLESRHIATTPRSWCRCKNNCLMSENCQWREHHGAARRQAMVKPMRGHLNASHRNVSSEYQHEGKTKEKNIHLRNRSVANGGHKSWGFLPVSFVLKPWKEYPFFQIWLGKGVFMFDQLSHLLPNLWKKCKCWFSKTFTNTMRAPLQIFVSRTSLKSS